MWQWGSTNICIHLQDRTFHLKHWYLLNKYNAMFQKTIILKEYSPLVIINVFKMHAPWTNKTKQTYLSFIGCKRNLIHKNCDNYIGWIVFRLLLWILYMFLCYPYCKYLRTPFIFSVNKSTAYDIKWLQYALLYYLKVLPKKVLQTLKKTLLLFNTN
jgi:hypothetical protein